MSDALFERAQLAIEENRALRAQRRALEEIRERRREELRSAVLKAAEYLAAVQALREREEP